MPSSNPNVSHIFNFPLRVGLLVRLALCDPGNFTLTYVSPRWFQQLQLYPLFSQLGYWCSSRYNIISTSYCRLFWLHESGILVSRTRKGTKVPSTTYLVSCFCSQYFSTWCRCRLLSVAEICIGSGYAPGKHSPTSYVQGGLSKGGSWRMHTAPLRRYSSNLETMVLVRGNGCML